MKTMYKGVLTVAAATFVASSAIMMTGAETKQANESVTKAEEKTVATSDASSDSAVVKKVAEDSAKAPIVAEGRSPDKTALAPNTVTKPVDTTQAGADAKEGGYPPPPPGPFTITKGENEASPEVIVKPVAPTKPSAIDVPTVPVAPAFIAEEKKLAPANVLEAKSGETPAVQVPQDVKSVAVPEAPVAKVSEGAKNMETPAVVVTQETKKADVSVETVTQDTKSTEAPVAKVSQNVKGIEVPATVTEQNTKSAEAPIAKVSQEVKNTDAPAATVAQDVKSTEASATKISQEAKNAEAPVANVVQVEETKNEGVKVPVVDVSQNANSKTSGTEGVAPKASSDVLEVPKKPEISTLQVPVAPTEMKAPAKPEITQLNVPEKPKTASHSSSSTNTVTPQAHVGNMKMEQPLMPPRPMMFQPQQGGHNNAGQQNMRMMPPQMMMPQGMKPQMLMPPQMMMPSQIINGQRVIMVPVYPMNMGRPAYPSGQQVPPAATKSQQNTPQGQPTKPNSQQQAPAPAENVEK